MLLSLCSRCCCLAVLPLFIAVRLPFAFHPDESMTLTRVLDDFKLQNYLEIISKVGDSAGKEYQIESSLNKMEDAWAGKVDVGKLEKGAVAPPAKPMVSLCELRLMRVLAVPASCVADFALCAVPSLSSRLSAGV